MSTKLPKQVIVKDRGAPAKSLVKPKQQPPLKAQVKKPAPQAPLSAQKKEAEYLLAPKKPPVSPPIKPVVIKEKTPFSLTAAPGNPAGKAIANLAMRTHDTPQQAAKFLYAGAARYGSMEDEAPHRAKRQKEYRTSGRVDTIESNFYGKHGYSNVVFSSDRNDEVFPLCIYEYECMSAFLQSDDIFNVDLITTFNSQEWINGGNINSNQDPYDMSILTYFSIDSILETEEGDSQPVGVYDPQTMLCYMYGGEYCDMQLFARLRSCEITCKYPGDIRYCPPIFKIYIPVTHCSQCSQLSANAECDAHPNATQAHNNRCVGKHHRIRCIE